MHNKKNSPKPTWVPFNTWEAQQKALTKANLEATKAQEEANKRAQKEAMMKIHDWGTPSGKAQMVQNSENSCHNGNSQKGLSGKCMKFSKISENSLSSSKRLEV